MVRRAIIKRYNERIITKNRKTEVFFRNEFKLERAYDYRNTNVKREKVLNELYRESGALNNYISSIDYSIICHNEFPRKGEEVVYFTDTKGRCREVSLPGVWQMMKKQSYSLVTLEGILLLYSSKQIVATVDCFKETSALAEDIDREARNINFLFIDYIKRKTYVNYATRNKGNMQKEICFSFDFTAQKAPSSVVKLNFR